MSSQGRIWDPLGPCSRCGSDEVRQHVKYIFKWWAWRWAGESRRNLDTVQAAPCGFIASGMGLLARLAAQSLCSSPPWLFNGYLALDQSLHRCASVSLSVAGGGDGEGEDKNTQGVENAKNKEGASWGGVAAMGTTGQVLPAEFHLGPGASRVYNHN